MNSISNALENIVPISDFNRGGAGHIFAEVARGGIKIVVKNNVPAGVVLSPEAYKGMVSEVEDARLALLAMQRLEKNPEVLYDHADVMKQNGISADDLKGVEVDFE